MLEARACGCRVEVAADNPKLAVRGRRGMGRGDVRGGRGADGRSGGGCVDWGGLVCGGYLCAGVHARALVRLCACARLCARGARARVFCFCDLCV